MDSEGDQPWDFFGRNDAKAETPVLWPPHAKSWLTGKDFDAGRDWGQEEKGTAEDEMAGWHHGLDGHESEWTPGDGDGQGGLACCDSWGRKESTTERLNWTELNWVSDFCDPMDCSPPGSSFHGILQARILGWVVISFSRGSSWPREQTHISHIAGRFFTVWATGEAPQSKMKPPKYIFLQHACGIGYDAFSDCVAETELRIICLKCIFRLEKKIELYMTGYLHKKQNPNHNTLEC